MTHVTDDLELYVLDALGPAELASIAAHLGECPACREQARVLEEVAVELPDTLPLRQVPARLRARILATARGDLARETRPALANSWKGRLRPNRLAIAALSAAVLVLGAIDIATARQRDVAQAERNEYSDVALRVSHGGTNWYMAGLDRWAGSGGTLYAPAKPDAAAFVVFHDLRPIDPGTVYALWLVDADGHWTRAANFTPEAGPAQAVVLDLTIAGSTQCALTVELQREGKRAGPLVMRSQIAPSTQ